MKITRLHLFLAAAFAIGILSALIHAAFPLLVDKTKWFWLAYSDIVPNESTAHTPGIPYLDYLVEYPVLTGLFIRLMGVLGPGRWQYYGLTCGCLILLAVLGTYFLYRSAKFDDSKRLLRYWILAPSMFFFLIYNWDIMPVLCVIVALYLNAKDKDCLASVALAFGFSCKFYPVLYLVPLLMKHRTASSWVKIIGAFGATALALNLFFMVSNFDGWYHFFSFNSTREPNPDSIWGIAYYWIRPQSVVPINILSLLLFAGGSAIAVWRFRHESTIRLWFALTLVFLLSNKVFSPQYSLWLLPFFVLSPSPGTDAGRRLFYAFELSNLAVLFCFWSQYEPAKQTQGLVYAFQFFTVIRHVLLLWILAKVMKGGLDTRHSPQNAGGPDGPCRAQPSEDNGDDPLPVRTPRLLMLGLEGLFSRTAGVQQDSSPARFLGQD